MIKITSNKGKVEIERNGRGGECLAETLAAFIAAANAFSHELDMSLESTLFFMYQQAAQTARDCGIFEEMEDN